MPAPKGHPPYPGCETGGRPKKYTEEFLDKEADDFILWMKKPDSLLFNEFAIERGYIPQRLSEFAKMSEKFSLVYELAKNWQETKLCKGAITKDYSGDFTKFMLINHHDYKDKTETKLTNDPDNPVGSFLNQANGKSKDLVHDE